MFLTEIVYTYSINQSMLKAGCIKELVSLSSKEQKELKNNYSEYTIFYATEEPDGLSAAALRYY